MPRNSRTLIQGTVTSVKMNKTIVVTVTTERNHPLYGKRVSYSKKFFAHDENNQAQVGDLVTLMACRPLSKTKRFRLVSIDKKRGDVISNEPSVAEETLEEEKETESEPSSDQIGAAEKPSATSPEEETKEAGE